MLQGDLSKIHCPDTVIKAQHSFGRTTHWIARVPRHNFNRPPAGRLENLHQGEGGVVRRDPGEVVLQHGQGAGQRHVAAAAE